LNNSFQPTDEIRIARTLWRQRGNLVAGVSDIKIIGAILQGECDPWHLAALVEPEVKAAPQDIAKEFGGE
jgi:hypothetical protein